MSGTLYIVATPIGNLEDITARAVRVLREVDLIACEDTRHTRKLLSHFGINTRTISYHQHNERERTVLLCRLINEGKNVALVSDAGMPLISDPGFRVVNATIAEGFPVVSIPGAVAFVTGLAASGLPTDEFFFSGFLPPRAQARRAKLESLRTTAATLVFYEAPHRIAGTLQDALVTLGDRQAVIARELTKLHEEFTRGHLSELAQRFSEKSSIRGEIVLMIAGAGENPKVSGNAEGAFRDRVLTLENEGRTSKEALKTAAREFGLKRAEAYRLLLAQKKRRSK